MATYFFETISTAQAVAFGAADRLVFGTAGVSAASVQASLSNEGGIVIQAGGRSVTFPATLLQTDPSFPDGSRLALGSTGPDSLVGTSGADQLRGAESGDTLSGLAGSDSLSGEAASDRLQGGPGGDTLRGGTGEDTLEGGDGADVFDFDRGDTSQTSIDSITDWSVFDQIRIVGGGGAYQEISEASELAALSRASNLMGAAGGVVAAQVPGAVMVYASNGGVVQSSVRLVGRTLADISAGNVVALPGAGGTLPPPPAPPPTGQAGTAGADTIEGGAGGDSISGLGGDDLLAGGGGGDTIAGGDGADTLNGGAGADRLEGGPGADRIVIGLGESPTFAPDTVVAIEPGDRIMFAGGLLRADFESLSELTYDKGLAFANSRIGAGLANFVLMRTGDGTFLFVDSNNDDGVADDVVRISVSTGYTFSVGNLVAIAGAEPSVGLPPIPSHPTGLRVVTVRGNMDLIQPGDLIGSLILDADDTGLELASQTLRVFAGGTGFTYSNNQLVGGAGTSLNYEVLSAGHTILYFSASGVSYPAASLGFWVAANAAEEALSTLLVGADRIDGSDVADLIRGYAGNDLIRGVDGDDSIFGGAGDDLIYAAREGRVSSGRTYLRGDDGADFIVGGGGFDDINGNMGADTATGGAGDDWVVGGKENDLLFGDAGGDLVYGNLGSDTCEGGDGADTIRGGQDDDAVRGGAGDDYVSGDRGADTMTGGAGADIFHSFGEAGIDRVADFRSGEGDRVLLDPGTQYTLAQVGADTVISMVGGGQMILVGVQLGSLPPGWIFGA